MIIIPNLSQDISDKAKRFRRRNPGHFVFEGNGKQILIVHGSEHGKLSIPDEDLEVMLLWLDTIICCYPRRVREVYERLFPGISSKILHKWADIPTCFGIFDQKPNKKVMAVLDYIPKKNEWNVICDDIELKIKTGAL